MIFVAWHLGLGDAIACAAIVAKLAESNEEVIVPCFDHNEVSVKSFFVNIPNVTVLPEKDKGKLIGSYNMLKLGFYNNEIPKLQEEDFVEWFYRQSGVDISEKETYCPIIKACESVKQIVPIGAREIECFVHDDVSRGFEIDMKKVKEGHYFKPVNHSKSILQYSKSIIDTKEVHCIDSSFLHLAEALKVPGKKVYHKYARPESTDYNYLKGWEVLSENS